jgi:flagellar motor protein MotB
MRFSENAARLIPVANNDTETGRAKHRRIETYLAERAVARQQACGKP